MLAPHASEAAIRRAPQQRIHRLTFDAKLQASLENLAHDGATQLGPKLSAAILVIDNASGEIRAHVGAADYFSQERAGAIDMTEAMRSPGSTLKPFIYALAFETGSPIPRPCSTIARRAMAPRRRTISTFPFKAQSPRGAPCNCR